MLAALFSMSKGQRIKVVDGSGGTRAGEEEGKVKLHR